MTSQPAKTQFLTTKEVADLLRVKERKVYDLAAADEIPHRRITGKLLFPADELHAWIDGDSAAQKDRPPIIAGSHDPLLDWAARQADAGLATLFDGSAAGLTTFAAGDAVMSGMHIPTNGAWNLPAVEAADVRGCVLIGMALREQGLITRPDLADRVSGVEDLSGLRVVLRQPGAGSRTLFDQLTADLDMSRVNFAPHPARTETEAAQDVAEGRADVGFGLGAAARQFGLGFVPLAQDQFDLLIDRKSYFLPQVQALLSFFSSEACADRARSLGGYDLSPLGKVRWVSP